MKEFLDMEKALVLEEGTFADWEEWIKDFRHLVRHSYFKDLFTEETVHMNETAPGCEWLWSLTNLDMGVEVDPSTDPFVQVFNGVTHMLVFNTTDATLALENDGVRNY